MEIKEISDDRFAHISRDPRFRRPRKDDQKVKIDKRFEGMFNDQKFKVKFSVDKRGKPVKHTSSENLRKFYELSEDDDEDDKEIVDEAHSSRVSTGDDDDNDDDDASVTDASTDDDDGEMEHSESEDESGIGSGPDLARGDGNVTTSDEEDDDDEDDKNDAEDESSVEHQWGEPDKEISEASDISHRLAICNMNWDRLKARDLFVMLNSFKPAKGSVLSVKIYPSDYGRARMREEQVAGPKEIIESGKQRQMKGDYGYNDESCFNEGQAYHREKLRQYQLKRLKYYYAVAECDSALTANHIYDECDGLEYESSSSRLDLRFIPDEITFDQDPTSTCTDMPETDLYKPPTFATTALCQSKVELTWDETDRERIGLTSKRYTKDDIKELDFEAYLASSSESEGEADEKDEDVGGGYEFQLALIDGDGDGTTPAKASTDAAKADTDDAKAGTNAAKVGTNTTKADTNAAKSGTNSATAGTNTTKADTNAAKSGTTATQPNKKKATKQSDRSKDAASDNADKIEKITVYKSLVNAGENVHRKTHDQDMEMQITWEPGLRDVTEKLVQKKGEKSEVTPWEEYLQKKKEKKKEKKHKKKLEMSGGDLNSISTTVSHGKKSGLSEEKGDNPRSGDEGGEAFSDDDIPEGVDFTDPFFAEELGGHQKSAKTQKVGKKKKKRNSKTEDLSPAEKEELTQNKAELSLLMMEAQEDGKQHFNLKDLVEGENKRKSKKRRRKQDKEEAETEIEDTFAINIADPRFDAVYSSHHYNIDPTAPEFKKTKAMDTIIEEKLKRRKEEDNKKLQSSVINLKEAKIRKHKLPVTLPESSVSEKVKDASISSLVKSVKLKTQQYHNRKKLK